LKKSKNLAGFLYDISLISLSNDPIKYKWEIVRVLIALRLKRVFNKSSDFEVTQRIFGFKITSYNYENLIYLFRCIFLSREYHFHCEHDHPNIIDCGANIGMSVLYFKFIYPNCSITAFEPNPDAFSLLKRNVEENNLTNINLQQYALSNEEGPITFFTDGRRKCLIASIFSERGGKSSEHVQAMKLSKFIKHDCFDLIKIDIEGAEPKVLHDLVSESKLLNSSRYIIEYHHRVGTKHSSSLADFIKAFEQKGFGYNIKASYSTLGGFQDVILHFYKE
jgi:FkbM family methyltransferase